MDLDTSLLFFAAGRKGFYVDLPLRALAYCQAVKFRCAGWFLVAELLVCLLMFRDGMWGGSLLAPLDIAPNLLYKYRYLDPAARGVPANHYSVDQLFADLPLQYTIHQSYRRGEIPWWDPYTYGGMPLLADGHSNGTDFVRLMVYALLPFEWAYNWTIILRSILIGLGMFLLLRRWNVRLWICLLLSLTCQFSGCFTIFWQAPWIQGSFVYYPYLWLVWDRWFEQKSRWDPLIAALLTTGIFYAGSVQSDSYLGLFALALGWGYAGKNIAEWKRWLPAFGLSCLIAVCLAAPVLTGQIDLFLLSERAIPLFTNKLQWLRGLASLSAVYPWSLGTFRTLDLSKFLGDQALGFYLFIGSLAFVLAFLGGCLKPPSPVQNRPRRMALVLIVLFFVILSTPLVNLLYGRCAGLAVMGLITLAAFGLERLLQMEESFPRVSRLLLGFAIALALVTNIGAWVIYPRLLPKVRQLAEHHERATRSLDIAPALRAFQATNLPAEVSFQNPETILACGGLIVLAVILRRPSLRKRPFISVGMLLLNLLPVLLFAGRYMPRQEMFLWHRLLEGGPEQKKVAAKLSGTPYRLWEISPGWHEGVMPATFGHLYRVRTVHGYSSLGPPSLFKLSPAEQERWRSQTGDWIYESTVRGQTQGVFRPNATPGLARFQWQATPPRTFRVEDAGLNKIRVTFEPGPAGELLWTDTHYPGWKAKADGRALPLKKAGPCFSKIEIPSDIRSLDLCFQPRYLRAAAWLTLVGILGMGILSYPRLSQSAR